MVTMAVLFFYGWLDWKTLKTDDFTIIYKDGYRWEALHTLQNLHYYQDSVRALLGDSVRNLPVVIEDVGALSNGFANPVFHNVHIFTRPPDFAYRLEGIESWYRTVAVHEYAHILHMSRTGGPAGFLTSVFGSLFAPNIYSPGWITEGITVYSESRNTRYEGRLNDGFFDSYIGARVHGKNVPSIIEATNAPFDFPFGTYYLYGGEFFDFLANRYGEEKFSAFFSRYGSYFWSPLSAILPFTGIDIAARKVFGRSWPRLFAEWQAYEEHRYRDWQPAGIPVTGQGWYVYSLVQKDNYLYYVRYRPVKVDGFHYRGVVQLVKFDCRGGSERILASLSSANTSPLRLHGNKIYYTTQQFKNGYANVYLHGYGVVADLHERDLLTGNDRIVLTDDIRSFCVEYGDRILYSRDRAHGFGSEMWIYDGHDSRFLFETDMLVGELVATREHTAVVARHNYENWNVYLLDYEAMDFVPVITTPWIEGSIALNGDSLFFTANYGGTYSIYMCDLTDRTFYRLTNNGYADWGVRIDTALYFLSMSVDGFDIYASGFKPVAFEPSEETPSRKPDFEEMPLMIEQGGYGDILQTFIPSFRVPLVLPTSDDLSTWAYGLLFVGGDATDENLYGGFIAHDSQEQDMIFNMLWQSRFFSPLDILVIYDYKNSLDYTLACPAYLNLGYGLSRLYLFLDGRVFEGTTRVEFAPGFGLGMEYPYTSVSVSWSFPFERQAYGSSINRSAQCLQVAIGQYLLGGELSLKSDAYVDQRNPEICSFSLRGYESIETPRALVTSLEYSHRLVELRRGAWNPNLYFEDLFWAVFVDFAWADDGTTYYSAGVELRLEAKTGFGFVQLVPKLGVAVNKSRESKVFLEISPEIPF